MRAARRRSILGRWIPTQTGCASSSSVAVPAGAGWTLPAYELALLAAADVQRLGLRTRISLVTPEPRPLAAFGENVSDMTAFAVKQGGIGARSPT